ncbi:ATP-grasp domain-containing protein [Streptomyces silvisoli]|uniref:ATP-grasp domain-containing protein n=1 Tax=Streptomyces silvisoli TaxID=3034235 RepID=A0ABT5ZKY7_9ACTN|nr:ATP-grasp domain-containing protein [Streptomyces silvisoli]MDF3290474.1 ATP-grasp domain-containing protein [Streptomyces silvisoli]
MSEQPLHLLLIAGVGGLSAADALAAARRATPRVSLVFVAAWSPPDAAREAWERAPGGGAFLVADGLDGVVDAAVALHGRVPLHGVVTYSELLLRPQAEIADRLGLPGNSPRAVAVAQSKARQRAAFAAHAVPSPRSAVIRGDGDLAAAVSAVGLPAVFKPSLGAGSQGVHLVSTAGELADAFRRGLGADTPFIQRDDAFLLEEPMRLEGTAPSPYADYVSVESLLFHGAAQHLAVSDRLRLRHGYVEEGLVLPSRLDEPTARRVVDCADQAIKAIGLTHGAVHTEIAVLPDGPRVIEVNARAGGPLPNLLREAAGYDFAREIARTALGLRPAPRPRTTSVAWFRFVPIPAGEWRVVSQRTVEEVRAAFPRLVRLGLRFRPGQQARRDTTQHLAAFTVVADSTDEARRTAEAVERYLDIRLEPVDERQGALR